MGTKFSIRRAGPLDAEGIVQCLHTAFACYRAYYSPEGFADSTLTPYTVLERLGSMSVYVALDGERVIGTIACGILSPGEGHLRGMAVLPDWQGRGIAEQLLAAVEAELRQRGCQRITLDTTAPLQRAIRFYERNGYTATGKVSDFFGMPLYEYGKNLD
jgi:ribosomal protein S18 acetylase RimI-like enzyme